MLLLRNSLRNALAVIFIGAVSLGRIDVSIAQVLHETKISDTQGGFEGILGNGDRFGAAIDTLGDFDGDGVTELVVGAYLNDGGGPNRGAIWILFLDSDGTVKQEQEINDVTGGFSGSLQNYGEFGESVTCLGDLDRDGISDVAVGHRRESDGGEQNGAVWVLFLDSTGTVKSEQKISETSGGFGGDLDDYDHFGQAVANIGDVDKDGVVDLAVGAFKDDDGGSNRGAVWILLLNTDGTVKSEFKISDLAGGFTGTLSDDDHFGVSLHGIPDYNSDGVNDLLVGASLDDDGGTDRGAVWLLSLDTLGVRSHTKISDLAGGFTGTLADEDHFGGAVAFTGDLNSDSVIDMAVGAPKGNDGGSNRGALWLLLMNPDGTVKSNVKISDASGGFGGTLDNGDEFGLPIRALGDLNQDGMIDLVVGAKFDDDGGQDRGAAWVLFSRSPSVTLSTKAFLSGAYAGFGLMAMAVPFEIARPKLQPYGDPFFAGSPLYFASPDSISVFPDSTVDWVLVELRSGADSTTQAQIRSAFIRRDGSIVDVTGDRLRFGGLGPDLYWVIIRHRNHLPIMSPGALDFSSGYTTWDFTSSSTQAFSSGGSPMKDLGDGYFGMVAGDVSLDGQVTASDFNIWLVETKAGVTGYRQPDFNLDGQVTATDFNHWLTSTKSLAKSHVPD